MLRHRTNVGRHHIQRIFPVGGSFDSWYADNFGAIGWKLQEPSGNVALAINKRVELGRELLFKDFTGGLWETVTATIDDLDSFTTTSSGQGVRANDPAITAGKTYTARIKGTTAAGSFDIRDFNNVHQYAIILGGGAFDESFTFTALADGIYFRILTGSGTTDIDWANTTIEQTDIASDKEFPGTELLANNGSMLAAVWGANSGAILSNDISDDILRNTAPDSDTVTRAIQFVATPGKRYGTIIKGRNDGGAAIPRLTDGSSTFLSLLASSSFQSVDVEHVFVNDFIGLATATNGVGAQYTEWTEGSFTERNPINARNNGMSVAQTGQGNIPLVYSGDGGTTRLSFDTIAEINSIINMLNGGFVMAAKSDTWAAGVDVLARFAVDADNEIVIFRDGTDLKIEYRETATSSIVTIPSGSPSGMFTIGGKWNVPGFGLRGLYNGVQVDTDKSIAAAIIGNLDKDECALFAEDSGGTASWSGDGAYPALQTETPNDSFFAEYHSRSGL